jgi:hypothetical protein
MTQIKRIYDGTVLFSHDSVSVKETLLAAIAAGADLRSADLRGANLRDANLPADYRIARIDFGGWSVTITPTETSIGCQMHPNELWLKADPRWIDTMDMGATAWWARHGATIQAAIRDVQS